MSKYKKFDWNCTNRASLLLAIQATNLPFEQAADNSISLYRYALRDQEQHASLVIRKENLASAYNDLGFALQPDGSYTAVVGDYGKGAAVLNQIKQEYTLQEATRVARANGYTVTRHASPGGVIDLICNQY
jgi:hypothetical protein